MTEPHFGGQPGKFPRYDALAADVRDRLREGVISVDGEGVVLEANSAAAAILDVPRETMRGRNFFRDLAPSTNVPRGYGRFLAGVRGHGVETSGTFSIDRAPRPVQADLRMASAMAEDRHWIALVPHPVPETSPAPDAVDRRSRAEPVDVTACEREPIHIPGTIQPGAILLVADETLNIVARSDNAQDILRVAHREPIGQPLGDVLPEGYVARIRTALASGALSGDNVLSRALHLPDAGGEPFLAACHAHAGRILVELEPIPARPEDFGPERLVGTGIAVARLRGAGTIAEIASTAAREIRDITGFESVLIYRFDPDWNGEAIAEDKAEDWPRSLLGLHFPASDIPSQARALYLKAKSRFVTDRDALPVPLVGSPDMAGRPIDLTYAQHRSLSPIHMEYQRNLGVNGSMSTSIIVDGTLWGLVIGHHRRPHYVTPDMRAVAMLLTDAFAMRVQETEGRRVWAAQQAHLAAEGELVRKLTQSDDFVEALTAGDTTILDLFESTGAAVVSRGKATLLGRTPSAQAIIDLAAWLIQTHPRSEHGYVTNALSQAYPPAQAYAEQASGLLAVFVDEASEHLLLWFKPEMPSTVTWSGDPRKAAEPGPGAMIMPRRSFERWVEERRRFSTTWATWKVSFANSLAQVVEGVALKQRRMIAELTVLLGDKERLLEQKDILSREIDHRVKNSLQIVSAFLQMQERQTKDPDAKLAFAETSARVMSVARVHDSLYQAENTEDVDLGHTIEVLCRDLSRMASEGQTVGISADAKVMVPYRKAIALSLIATELVTNALKYAKADAGAVGIDVSIRAEEDGHVRLRVCDDGVGLPDDWANRPAKGTGLGMKLVRAMLSQIDASMEVHNSPGACFTVHA